jgi:hypothetical protein
MAELVKCKLCGGEAQKINVRPDESMHSGWVTVKCARCTQSHRVEPCEFHGMVGWEPGDTGWSMLGRQLSAAEREAVRRWNMLNAVAARAAP